MLHGFTRDQISQQRQEFERGLLAVIINDNRQVGLELMSRVASRLGGAQSPDNTWLLLARWLNALARHEIVLTSAGFVLLREVGKALKQLDQQVEAEADSATQALLELALLRSQLESALAPESSQASDSWLELLNTLQQAAGLVPLRDGFVAVADFAAEAKWSDALEVASAQTNLLDRLLDATLSIHEEHWDVLRDATALLQRLRLPESGGDESTQSQIDDATYERVIERADVLASGGEFSFAEEGGDVSVHLQLETVLDTLPGLLQTFRAQSNNEAIDATLEDAMQNLVIAAEQLQSKLP